MSQKTSPMSLKKKSPSSDEEQLIFFHQRAVFVSVPTNKISSELIFLQTLFQYIWSTQNEPGYLCMSYFYTYTV